MWPECATFGHRELVLVTFDVEALEMKRHFADPPDHFHRAHYVQMPPPPTVAGVCVPNMARPMSRGGNVDTLLQIK